MACNCFKPNACTCSASGSPGCGRPTTKCDRYRPGDKNVWVERGNTPNDVTAPGICMLDTMTTAQVIYVLERDEVARADLLKVTSDVDLLALAANIARLPSEQEDDKIQTDMNRNHAAASIPFYAIFRGQPPFAQ